MTPVPLSAYALAIFLPLDLDVAHVLQMDAQKRILGGGATSFMRSPAEGRRKSGPATEHDDIAVIEVMAEMLDRDWWAELGRRLEHEFHQDEVILHCQPTDRL